MPLSGMVLAAVVVVVMSKEVTLAATERIRLNTFSCPSFRQGQTVQTAQNEETGGVEGGINQDAQDALG